MTVTTVINHAMGLLVEELAAEGVADPLGQAVTVAAVWDDLARLTGGHPPLIVQRLLAGGTPPLGESLAPQPTAGLLVTVLCARLRLALASEPPGTAAGGPLARRLPLASLWIALGRLNGEAVPVAVCQRLSDGPPGDPPDAPITGPLPVMPALPTPSTLTARSDRV